MERTAMLLAITAGVATLGAGILLGIRGRRRDKGLIASRWIQKQVDLLRAAAGAVAAAAGSEAVLNWPCVQRAPPPSMDMGAVQEGQAVSFTDARGAIHKFKLGPDVYVNMYFTKAGNRRSGDIHDCVQYDVVLRGAVRLRMFDPATGTEVVRVYRDNDFIVIPPRTPHMFEMLEDNYLLEWWGGEFKAWYYIPYRQVINEGPSLASTAAADFSVQREELERWHSHAGAAAPAEKAAAAGMLAPACSGAACSAAHLAN